MEQKVRRSIKGEAMQACLQRSSDSAEVRGGHIAPYIYISTSHWRFDARLRKHPRKVFKAAKVLWSHDVRICVAIGILPLSLAVLD
jgi:hypothetical protein